MLSHFENRLFSLLLCFNSFSCTLNTSFFSNIFPLYGFIFSSHNSYPFWSNSEISIQLQLLICRVHVKQHSCLWRHLLYLQYLQILNSVFILTFRACDWFWAVSSLLPSQGLRISNISIYHQTDWASSWERLAAGWFCGVRMSSITQYSPEHWAVCVGNQVTTDLFGTMFPWLCLFFPQHHCLENYTITSHNDSRDQFFNYVLLQFYVSCPGFSFFPYN